MGRKGRKFIDKKKDSVHSFKVVRRSQRDPLVADENAPQGVLVTTNEGNKSTKEETQDYGVFFDDDYDYLQHLRGTKESIDWEDCDLEVYTLRKKDKKASKNDHQKFNLMFPSSAFESYLEEPVGMLNKAAPVSGPQPDIDPDIVAELDRLELDEESGEEIPDDFFMLMNSEEPIDDGDDIETNDSQYSKIKVWLDCEEDYDDISPNETVNEHKIVFEDEFIEEINKRGNLSTQFEDDDDEDYEDIEEEDIDDLNVSDDESEQASHLAGCANYLDNLCNNCETMGNEIYNTDYDPLGYGGNVSVINYENEGKDVLHPLPTSKKHLGCDATSQTSRTSPSCANLPRPGLLPWLDKRFEYVYETEYSKDQFGALDDQEIEGHISVESEVFKQIMEKTRVQIEKLKRVAFDDTDKDRTANWIRQRMFGKTYQKEAYKEISIPNKENRNCETNLSLRTKVNNQPEILDANNSCSRILINRKRGYPLLQEKSNLTIRALAQHDQDDSGVKDKEFETETLKSRLSLVSYRPPNETSEDKRDRKKALKELRRERRIEKKFNKEAFKQEKKTQIRTQMNILHNKKVSLC